MTRKVTYNQKAKVDGSHLLGAMFVQISFAFPLRLSNLGYNLSWGGFEWLGVGDLGDVEPIYEGSSLEARGVAMTLSAVPNDIIASALAEQYQGKAVDIWFCPCTNLGRLVDEPVRVFFGRLDTMNIETGDDTSMISLTAETKIVDWHRPRGGRINHVDQVLRYPDDIGLIYIEELVEKEIRWGRA